MSDLAVVVLAVATALGAWAAAGPHPVVGASLALVALAFRRPWLFVVGVAVLASAFGQRAWDGLAPVSVSPVDGWVTLVGDPALQQGRVLVDVRYRGRRYEAAVRDRDDIVAIRDRLAGERVLVRGDIGPSPPGSDWLAVRHVVGRLEVRAVRATAAAAR